MPATTAIARGTADTRSVKLKTTTPTQAGQMKQQSANGSSAKE